MIGRCSRQPIEQEPEDEPDYGRDAERSLQLLGYARAPREVPKIRAHEISG